MTNGDGWERLDPMITKLNDPSRVTIPNTYKNPLSDFFKRLRSRMGVKLYKDKRCNNCGACDSVCNNNAIKTASPTADVSAV